MIDEIRIPPTRTGDRNQCSESSASVSIAGSPIVTGILLAASLVSLVVAFYALASVRTAEARAQNAIERAGLSERESRIMTAEVQYIRAWAGAQGIRFPIDHEDAESVALPNHSPDAKLVHHRHAR